MTERITSQMTSNMVLDNINNDLTQLDQTQTELSSGESINEPSDNPSGTAQVLQLNDQIAQLSNYTTNINNGTAWTDTASSSLQSIYQLAETAQETTTEAANGTLSSSDLQDTAEEIGQLIDAIKQNADTQYDGQYIFSGTATGTEPYATGTGSSNAYNGNTDTITATVGPGQANQVGINFGLGAVLGNGSDGNLLSTLSTIQTDMENGDQSDLGTQLDNLSANLDSLADLQSQVGGIQDQLSAASTRVQSLSTTDQTQLSNVDSVDVAQATTQYSTEQAGYEAALQSGSDLLQTSLMSFLQSS